MRPRPYEGKKTGETALLRGMLDLFDENDAVVFDRYCRSFMMLALLRQQGVHVCTRQHQLRSTDFRRGHRLGPGDHRVTWHRPQRPTWMSPEQYEQVPKTMTLTDSEVYSREEIAELYGFRWNAELDILQIKQTLHLDHVRCKTPERVRRELWVTLLAYNLGRKVIATSAAVHQKQARHPGFTFACRCHPILEDYRRGS
jgi:putative transposase